MFGIFEVEELKSTLQEKVTNIEENEIDKKEDYIYTANFNQILFVDNEQDALKESAIVKLNLKNDEIKR